MSRGGTESERFTPDQTIHEPTRLRIVSYLATSNAKVPFTELQGNLGLTAGNLSVQLKRLEEAGYVHISKTFRKRRPLTRAELTPEGMTALQRYLGELESMIDRVRTGADELQKEEREG